MRSETTDADGGLGRKIVAELPALTWHRIGPESVANARRNQSLLARGQSLAALRGLSLGEGDAAIVIGAGPSIKRTDPAKLLTGFRGAIVATESSIYYLLKNGIVPHLVVTVDPHATRIVRWFGDPELQHRVQNDDYFRRQDMDSAFARERETNDELLALLAVHGPKMRIAVSTSASSAVVNRVLQTGMSVYWWNPMLDDPDLPGSITRTIYDENRLPCVNAGGNVGAACWMMATEVLGKQRVGLSGLDFGYYADTPYEQTQYYRDAIELVGKDRLDEIFMKVFNPDLGLWFYTDPAYMWYRECFLQMVAESDAKTVNCTGGGILFGPGIDTEALEAFVRRG